MKTIYGTIYRIKTFPFSLSGIYRPQTNNQGAGFSLLRHRCRRRRRRRARLLIARDSGILDPLTRRLSCYTGSCSLIYFY